MSTHVPGFQPFTVFLHHFVMDKLATISIRVKRYPQNSPCSFDLYFLAYVAKSTVRQVHPWGTLMILPPVV